MHSVNVKYNLQLNYNHGNFACAGMGMCNDEKTRKLKINEMKCNLVLSGHINYIRNIVKTNQINI